MRGSRSTRRRILCAFRRATTSGRGRSFSRHSRSIPSRGGGPRSSSFPTTATARRSRRRWPVASRSPRSSATTPRSPHPPGTRRICGPSPKPPASSSGTARPSTPRRVTSGSWRSGTTATRSSESRSHRACTPGTPRSCARSSRAVPSSSPGTPERRTSSVWSRSGGYGICRRDAASGRGWSSARRARGSPAERASPPPHTPPPGRRSRTGPSWSRSPDRDTRRSSCAPSAGIRRGAATARDRCTRAVPERSRCARGAGAAPTPGDAPIATRIGCGWPPPAAKGPPTNSVVLFPEPGSSSPTATIRSCGWTTGPHSSSRPAAENRSPGAATAPSSCSTEIGC